MEVMLQQIKIEVEPRQELTPAIRSWPLWGSGFISAKQSVALISKRGWLELAVC